MPDDKLEREQKLEGMGASRLRKEDARFIRGQGTYVDDIKLPGCCSARSSAVRTRTRGSSRSTRAQR